MTGKRGLHSSKASPERKEIQRSTMNLKNKQRRRLDCRHKGTLFGLVTKAMASEMDLNTFQGKICLDGKITAQHD